MPRSLLVCSTDQAGGSSVITLGLFGILQRRVRSLSFLKPVGSGPEDQDVNVMKSAYRLDRDRVQMCPLSMAQARELVAGGHQSKLLDQVSRCYQQFRARDEFVLLEGINNQRSMSLFDVDINEAIAARLETPVLLVARAQAEDGITNINQLLTSITAAKRSFEEKDCEVVGVVVNRVVDSPFDAAERRITDTLKKAEIPLYGVVPNLAFLGYPRLDQIAAETQAEVLSGEEHLTNVATKIIVAAMEPRNFLYHLDTEWTLVITPGDRDAILLAVACAQKSTKRRSVSGVILSGGLRPDPQIMSLIEDLGAPNFPILAVRADTFTTANVIRGMDVRIRPQDDDKIYMAASAVWRHVDHERLWETMEMPRPTRRVGSRAFLDGIVDHARAAKQHIVLPEGDEPRTLRATRALLDLGACRLTLLGDPDVIRKAAEDLGVTIDGAEILNPATSPERERFIDTYVELRKGKKGGMTHDIARQWLDESRIRYGTLMVHLGQADGLVAGAVHSTGDTIRPALQVIRVKPDPGVASSVFFMALKDRVLVYGDCAIIPNPDAHELAAIAIESARTARAFGIDPHVAMLSYSTGVSGTGESVDKVAEATQMVKERDPDFAIDGPLQYDAAIDPEVGKLKWPDSPVAGRANVFIFPDLDAGNIAYKAVQRSAGVLAVGPILQGLNKPVNDLSRGCSVNDIVYTVAATAIQAGCRPRPPAELKETALPT
jgi:phosphate acetyltransferase